MEIRAMRNNMGIRDSAYCLIPANHPKRLYPLRDLVQQAWEQAGVKYVGDSNNRRPLGLRDLERAWVGGKRQLQRKFNDLSHVKVLFEMLACRVASVE